MASVVNFDQTATSQGFNIQLDLDGNLNFRANELNGGGPIRLVISDNSGQVTIGGSGVFGALQLKALLMATQYLLALRKLKQTRTRRRRFIW